MREHVLVNFLLSELLVIFYKKKFIGHRENTD